ncbi:MAG: hypothetical protein HRU16_00590 [Planctomycetes bacterium]|nr:hypothetical protein [Planctomycetota bacterium]
MAKRTRPRPRPAPVQAKDDNDLDFGDLTLGLVAAIVLPVMVAVVLGLVGMPVGGSTEFNSEQADIIRESDRFVPPMTDVEARIILSQVQYSVDNRAAEYIRRSRATEDAQEKNFWQEVSKGVLGPAEANLQRILDEAGRNLDMSVEIKDAAQEWITKVDTLRFQLDQEDPFRQIR